MQRTKCITLRMGAVEMQFFALSGSPAITHICIFIKQVFFIQNQTILKQTINRELIYVIRKGLFSYVRPGK